MTPQEKTGIFHQPQSAEKELPIKRTTDKSTTKHMVTCNGQTKTQKATEQQKCQLRWYGSEILP